MSKDQDQGAMDYLTIDSCHSHWVFDTEHHRFRRILKGLALGETTASTGWRPYHQLDLDPDTDSFVVVLDDSDTRIMRSWRHTEARCPQCDARGTEELSLEDIAHAEGD
jgi:hypothetical protein